MQPCMGDDSAPGRVHEGQHDISVTLQSVNSWGAHAVLL